MPTPTRRSRGRPKSAFSGGAGATLQSLDRALTLLQAIARRERATLSALVADTDIPAATVHRILSTLEARGFAVLDAETQEWKVGMEAFRAGAAFLKQTSLTEVGRPVMRRLMERTGETANLAIRDGFHVVFVGQIETHNPIRAFFAPGTRTAMHASGTGKAILAALPEAALQRWLSTATLTGFTGRTLVTESGLLADLEATRARGWSFDHEERYAGMSCIGAAIHDRSGEATAGVSISGPSSRFQGDDLGQLGAAVAEAAAEITLLQGGFAPGTDA